jgi:hypothetical protein
MTFDETFFTRFEVEGPFGETPVDDLFGRLSLDESNKNLESYCGRSTQMARGPQTLSVIAFR